MTDLNYVLIYGDIAKIEGDRLLIEFKELQTRVYCKLSPEINAELKEGMRVALEGRLTNTKIKNLSVVEVKNLFMMETHATKKINNPSWSKRFDYSKD